MKKKKILSIVVAILIILICVSSFIAIQYSKNNSQTQVRKWEWFLIIIVRRSKNGRLQAAGYSGNS